MAQKMISNAKVPAVNLLLNMDIFTHFEDGRGLKKANETDGISTKQSYYSKEATVAINYAQNMLNSRPHNEQDKIILPCDNLHNTLMNLQTYKDLCREHCQKLIELGYGIRRSAFKKLDSIDISPIANFAKKDPRTMPVFPVMKTDEYISHTLEQTKRLDTLMCMVVPPFTEFSYKLHKDRYQYVKIEEVSIEDLSIKMTVQDYTVQETLWIPGTKCSCIITFTCEKNNVPFINMQLYGQHYNPHDINHYIPFKDLGWNQREIDIWLKNDREYTQPVMNAIRQKRTSSCIELVKYILTCNGVTNYMLHGNKPKIIREPKEQKEKTPAPAKQTDNTNNKKLPERRVRYIGTVKVTSTTIPRQATPERVRHYKVAVWKARGGVRHMKDGRVIPFKESIKHRHKLKDKMHEQNVAQTTLKFHDNSHVLTDNPQKDD